MVSMCRIGDVVLVLTIIRSIVVVGGNGNVKEKRVIDRIDSRDESIWCTKDARHSGLENVGVTVAIIKHAVPWMKS
jgi:hypothetical protein